MNQPLVLTDDLLVRALQQRANQPVPSRLLERVVAAAAASPQPRARTWFPQAPRRAWLRPLLASAAAVALAVAVVFGVLRPSFTGPGHPTPVPTTSPSPTAPPPPAPTPETRLLGDAAALRLRLGINVGPIDVISAFDSIWVANIRANEVRRYDPATMAETARIHVTGGPAWFVEAGGALWVSTQNGNGLARIDPATNTLVARVGDDPPCAAPFVFGGDIWQAACDADVFLRIDPSITTVAERIPAQGHGFLVAAGDTLIATGPTGLARFDPVTHVFTELPGDVALGEAPIASDGETVWVVEPTQVLRIDPSDGRTVATFPYSSVVAVTFDAGHAWLSVSLDGAVEIDLATNTVLGTTPVPEPWVARMADGVLWVTDFNNSILWRIEP